MALPALAPGSAPADFEGAAHGTGLGATHPRAASAANDGRTIQPLDGDLPFSGGTPRSSMAASSLGGSRSASVLGRGATAPAASAANGGGRRRRRGRKQSTVAFVDTGALEDGVQDIDAMLARSRAIRQQLHQRRRDVMDEFDWLRKETDQELAACPPTLEKEKAKKKVKAESVPPHLQPAYLAKIEAKLKKQAQDKEEADKRKAAAEFVPGRFRQYQRTRVEAYQAAQEAIQKGDNPGEAAARVLASSDVPIPAGLAPAPVIAMAKRIKAVETGAALSDNDDELDGGNPDGTRAGHTLHADPSDSFFEDLDAGDATDGEDGVGPGAMTTKDKIALRRAREAQEQRLTQLAQIQKRHEELHAQLGLTPAQKTSLREEMMRERYESRDDILALVGDLQEEEEEQEARLAAIEDPAEREKEQLKVDRKRAEAQKRLMAALGSYQPMQIDSGAALHAVETGLVDPLDTIAGELLEGGAYVPGHGRGSPNSRAAYSGESGDSDGEATGRGTRRRGGRGRGRRDSGGAYSALGASGGEFDVKTASRRGKRSKKAARRDREAIADSAAVEPQDDGKTAEQRMQDMKDLFGDDELAMQAGSGGGAAGASGSSGTAGATETTEASDGAAGGNDNDVGAGGGRGGAAKPSDKPGGRRRRRMAGKAGRRASADRPVRGLRAKSPPGSPDYYGGPPGTAGTTGTAGSAVRGLGWGDEGKEGPEGALMLESEVAASASGEPRRRPGSRSPERKGPTRVPAEVYDTAGVPVEHLPVHEARDAQGRPVRTGLRDTISAHTEPVDYMYSDLDTMDRKERESGKYRQPGLYREEVKETFPSDRLYPKAATPAKGASAKKKGGKKVVKRGVKRKSKTSGASAAAAAAAGAGASEGKGDSAAPTTPPMTRQDSVPVTKLSEGKVAETSPSVAPGRAQTTSKPTLAVDAAGSNDGTTVASASADAPSAPPSAVPSEAYDDDAFEPETPSSQAPAPGASAASESKAGGTEQAASDNAASERPKPAGSRPLPSGSRPKPAGSRPLPPGPRPDAGAATAPATAPSVGDASAKPTLTVDGGAAVGGGHSAAPSNADSYADDFEPETPASAAAVAARSSAAADAASGGAAAAPSPGAQSSATYEDDFEAEA